MTAGNGPLATGGPSFWHLGRQAFDCPPLPRDAQADVAIVGAGFTGLWTAFHLKRAAPHLRITLLEAAFPGFGASGRNGGWLTGGFAWSHARYAADRGGDTVRDMVRAVSASVQEVVFHAKTFGAELQMTDELSVARNPAQLARLRDEIATRRHWGETLDEVPADALRARVMIPGALGAMRLRGVARVQPVTLVEGLVRAVQALGITIHGDTAARQILPGRIETARGVLRAPVILRATEGFTAGIAGHRRDILPLNSAQIVTEPLSAAIWSQIGWQGAELLGDFANIYCYCQRTADGRIALGGRGNPYRFASRTDKGGVPDARTIRALISRLHALFPALRGTAIAHAWCGPLGVPRDWCASVSFDPATGLGAAGGYVGVGVATSNLAGRTLADLVLRRDTDLTRLSWVNRPVRRWEREPLRWLGLQGSYALLDLADRHEARGGPPSPLARLANRIAGR